MMGRKRVWKTRGVVRAWVVLGLMLAAVTIPASVGATNRRAALRAREVSSMLERARASADRAAATDVERFQRNNYEVALNMLRQAGKKIGELAELAGPNDPLVAKARKAYAETKAYVDSKCATIRAKVLAETRAPKDAYRGRDRKKFERMVVKAWREAYPEDKILDVRFPSSNWKTTRTKRWNDAVHQWQYTNVSALPVVVIVANPDGKTATIYPAFINRDNQTGEVFAGVHTKYGGYVIEEMLLKNLD